MSTRFTRRRFLHLSSTAMLATLSSCRNPKVALDFPISVDDGLVQGHRLFESGQTFPAPREIRKQVLVVGAGVAGLAAACQLRHLDLVVCEIGDRVGGSSSAAHFQGLSFAQGAHYELPYPENYGSDALAFLADLGVISFQESSRMWEFIDRQFLIDEAVESRTWSGSGWRVDAIPQGSAGKRFFSLIRDFAGKMPMPTHLIKHAFRVYDRISFFEWLTSMNLASDKELLAGIDYQLSDDYGASSKVVSALAGIHYYQCRPYYSQDLLHFSPPEGNAYFINKMRARLGSGVVETGHVVMAIVPDKGQFLVDVLDLAAMQLKRFRTDQIVYAGHKHALKHVFPADAPAFANNRYAPWLTLNFVIDPLDEPAFWQNEVLGSDSFSQGFVNSAAQHGDGQATVLTAYFCLPESARAQLLSVAQHPEPWVARALAVINKALATSVTVQHAFIKVHGHAMPIPVPGYLFRDGNRTRSLQHLVYAGVDNGRLPLFFEALDSGVSAAALLQP